MYHMWLGPNGLPISPRKQRAKLFEFCTTHFVTEAEMRYCYARLLSVGNPSGPVKYAGQPQYDSEQVVSPLFTFAMPPSSPAPPPPPPPPPPPQAKSAPMQLAYTPFALAPKAESAGARSEWSAFSRAVRQAAARAEQKHAQHAIHFQHAVSGHLSQPTKSTDLKGDQARIAQLEREEAMLKAQLHHQAMKKIANSVRHKQAVVSKVAAAAPHPTPAAHGSLSEHIAAVRKITAPKAAATMASAHHPATINGALDHDLAAHYFDSDAKSALTTIHAAAAASLARRRLATPLHPDLELAKHYFQSRSPTDALIRAAAVAPKNPWYEGKGHLAI
jgi:hypothetical protein